MRRRYLSPQNHPCLLSSSLCHPRCAKSGSQEKILHLRTRRCQHKDGNRKRTLRMQFCYCLRNRNHPCSLSSSSCHPRYAKSGSPRNRSTSQHKDWNRKRTLRMQPCFAHHRNHPCLLSSSLCHPRYAKSGSPRFRCSFLHTNMSQKPR